MARALDNEEDIKSARLVVLLEDECHLVWKDALGSAIPAGNAVMPVATPFRLNKPQNSQLTTLILQGSTNPPGIAGLIKIELEVI